MNQSTCVLCKDLAVLVQPRKMCWASGQDPTVGDHSQKTKDGAWEVERPPGDFQRRSLCGSHNPFPPPLPFQFPLHSRENGDKVVDLTKSFSKMLL